jgi:hypothetical protein
MEAHTPNTPDTSRWSLQRSLASHSSRPSPARNGSTAIAGTICWDWRCGESPESHLRSCCVSGCLNHWG